MKANRKGPLVVIVGLLMSAAVPGAEPAASATTQASQKQVRASLPFENEQDFADARRGFIATLDEGLIKDESGRVVYAMQPFDFLQGPAPDTVNPSLWRQGRLNRIHGLFEVVDGIYQVRGFDLSNMTVIRGAGGWIVIDPLISAAPAKAALALVNKHFGPRPVKAVVYTHSHADHFGGVRGVVDEADVAAGEVKIVAPEHFLQYAVSENVIAGNAMTRRASYMFGNLLPRNAAGNVGAGLGQGTSSGVVGLIEPTDSVTATGQKMTLDGVEFVFQLTPDAEAPAEMMFYLPQFEAFCQAEEINHTLHNLYTLRGARVRDGLKWSKHIDDAIRIFGDRTQVSFGSHHWPTWGIERVRELMEKQRDTYRFIHDQTLRLANQGYTMVEIAEMVALPQELATSFANRGYYGSVSHDVKAQYQLYFGWFDANPANLNPLPPAESGARYVEFMGGAQALLEKARASYAKGEYRWVGTVLNHLVFAQPENHEARELLARSYEQLGYQAESGPWRNFYLSGAQELRTGALDLPTPQVGSPDIFKAVPLDLYLDYLSVRLNGGRAAGRQYVFNVEFTDLDQEVSLRVKNGVLNHRIGERAEQPDAAIKMTRATLVAIGLGKTTFGDQLTAGAVQLTGDVARWEEFLGLLEPFEFWFNIVTP